MIELQEYEAMKKEMQYYAKRYDDTMRKLREIKQKFKEFRLVLLDLDAKFREFEHASDQLGEMILES